MSYVIARIKGGIGNQLFCYAAARRLALKSGAELVIDNVTGFTRDHQYRRRYALDNFEIAARKATAKERLEPCERLRRGILKYASRVMPFHSRRYLEEETRAFDRRLLEIGVRGTVYLDGYWQSEKYFADVANVIRRDLTIRPPSDPENQKMAQRIRAVDAVAVHVRVQDGQASVDGAKAKWQKYYRDALGEIARKTARCHLFVFSNRFSAVAGLVGGEGYPMTRVELNGEGEDAYADLWLMSQCRHFVIADSTFSWWGAWLSAYEKKTVIAPAFESRKSSWSLVDTLPDSWVRC